MNRNDLVSIREGTPGDRNFILSTFLLGLYYGDSVFSNMEKDTFMKGYHIIAETLVDSSNTSLWVACLKEDPTTILGYALLNATATAVHFTFVKKPWRHIGIMKSLIPDTINSCTHLTKVGLSLIKKNPKIVFNPFLLTQILQER
jgi:hypothetical protein